MDVCRLHLGDLALLFQQRLIVVVLGCRYSDHCLFYSSLFSAIYIKVPPALDSVGVCSAIYISWGFYVGDAWKTVFNILFSDIQIILKLALDKLR